MCPPFGNRRNAERPRALQMTSRSAGEVPRNSSITLSIIRTSASRVRSIFARRWATTRGESAASRLAVLRVGDNVGNWLGRALGHYRDRRFTGAIGQRRGAAKVHSTSLPDYNYTAAQNSRDIRTRTIALVSQTE